MNLEIALCGKQALEIVERKFNENECCKVFKLILMDIDMPDMNGIETTKRIFSFYSKKKTEKIFKKNKENAIA